jgi:23S rRNA U2552 (ribose-2'-O)-methylase RlmE/FtsJ
MEKATSAKPPWTKPQWQRREKPVSLPEHLTFAEWRADSPTELQAAKERITALEATNRWELLKKMVNPYEMVYTHEDIHFHPSVAVIKPLSRSYFKLIEMLDVLQFFERLPKQTPKIRTAHIAEGPGGFIQAIADLTERNKKILQIATAMTLKPTDQHVPGWRRASGFLHHHREVRLHYGADGTGDVYKVANQDSFVEAAGTGINLFTADGGFDFSVNYGIQEQRVFNLLVCSATTGLRCLSQEGCFVLKLFDVFSESTMILTALMARCFSEWTLYKPAMSRPCNSERYFLGRGFKGLPPLILKALMEIQEHAARDLYPRGAAEVLSSEELAYMKVHVSETTVEQLHSIGLAEHFADHSEEWYSTQLPRDFATSLAWCQKFRVPYQTTKPSSVCPVVYTSAPAVSQQSPLPGDDLNCLVPSGPTSSTSYLDCSDQSYPLKPSQKDGDNHEQTQGAAP